MQMSRRQWRKLDIVERIEKGELTVAEGAMALGLSRRQMQRVRRRVRREGQAGVVHGNTGRVPKHKLAKLVRDRVIALRRQVYVDFNDQHFTEKLVEVEELDVSRASVRRILRAAGIGAARRRRPPKHRRRRDRRAQAGQMILWDGSRHRWLEDRGPPLCLMAAIDDATGELLPGGHFVEQECTLGYLRVLREVVTQKGVPLSAYMDRHGTLRCNDKRAWTLEEQLAGRRQPTQVKRALDDLGIQVLYALSPQAKGRVERLWGTLQDRLVSELRLAGACTVAAANRILERYRLDHNARFAIPAQDAHQAWRPCPDPETADALCALQYIRLVANNNTVRVAHHVIDIPRHPARATYAKVLVTVRHLLDGGFRVYDGGKIIAKAKSAPPTAPPREPRTFAAKMRRNEQVRRRRAETTRG
jgi:hypothetical protein